MSSVPFPVSSYLQNSTPYTLRQRNSPCFYGLAVAGSRRWQRLKAVQATQDSSQGQSNMNGSNNSQSGGGGPQRSSDNPFQQFQWLFGSVFLVVIPIWRRIQNVGDTIEKADKVVEKVEDIADKIGNIARKLTDDLPDGQLKLLVLKVLKIAEKVEEGADSLDNVLDKVTDSLDKIDESIEEEKEKKKKKSEEEEEERKEKDNN